MRSKTWQTAGFLQALHTGSPKTLRVIQPTLRRGPLLAANTLRPCELAVSERSRSAGDFDTTPVVVSKVDTLHICDLTVSEPSRSRFACVDIRPGIYFARISLASWRAGFVFRATVSLASWRAGLSRPLCCNAFQKMVSRALARFLARFLLWLLPSRGFLRDRFAGM